MTGNPATILIVDDLATNRMLLQRHVERLGHRTLQAQDGLAALTAVRAYAVDLVLLDIMMPVMDGFETLRALKADAALAHIPVVVISALSDMTSVARCITLGAEDFLFKPVNHVLLEARVEACLERKRLRDGERAACVAAAEANRAKDRFVALVSHELKNPLTALIGYADMLYAQGRSEPGQTGFGQLGHIRRLSRQMALVLEDLDDLSRIESEQLRLEPETLELGRPVEEALSIIEALVESRGHRLQVTLAPDLPPVWADPMRLLQVLTNLLSNACKYTPDGGTIQLEARQWESGVVEITVRDSGLGIAPEEQARIFEPFFRSANADVRLQPGTGLGLNITRRLVELQGGTIWFTSSPGQGTAFSFTLLAAPAEACAFLWQPSSQASCG